ncbi:SMI1/KNR4 family protein [Streptomyces sp. NRRL B-24484]|uniref:SMI1/KNR4 family protein n=1 Tax=Streptomyces sp. NRRL B-24484 TaxID=1463833 RepID=UPI0004BF1778|nr:SMI1/KNR4 family protein [Streptomyces sp. NRRL B-24484]
MADEMWAGVRERVEALDGAPGPFGAASHRFRLDPVLAPAEVEALQDWLGTALPEEYRTFLLEVGAGGAGPAYGVFPVGRTGGRWAWSGEGADLSDLDRAAEPFPATGPDPDALAALEAERPDEESFTDEDEYDTAVAEWHRRGRALLWAADRTVGAIVLCHLGCGRREWLVVSGPERGRMWSDGRADELDLAPLLDGAGRPVTFARWYLDWLDAAERHPSRPAA